MTTRATTTVRREPRFTATTDRVGRRAHPGAIDDHHAERHGRSPDGRDGAPASTATFAALVAHADDAGAQATPQSTYRPRGVAR